MLLNPYRILSPAFSRLKTVPGEPPDEPPEEPPIDPPPETLVFEADVFEPEVFE